MVAIIFGPIGVDDSFFFHQLFVKWQIRIGHQNFRTKIINAKFNGLFQGDFKNIFPVVIKTEHHAGIDRNPVIVKQFNAFLIFFNHVMFLVAVFQTKRIKGFEAKKKTDTAAFGSGPHQFFVFGDRKG